jgi:glutamate racemase
VVFDSGVGGLVLLAELIRLRPDLRFLYVADTAWMPYGTKASELISKRLEQLHARIYQAYGASMWVMACNTASSALPYLLNEADNPYGFVYGYHWIDLIGPTVKAALQQAEELQAKTIRASGSFIPRYRVALLATESTVQSQRYPEVLAQHPEAPLIELACFACPGLAQAVEGRPGPGVEGLMPDLMAPVLAWQPDVVILACTHYLHIEASFRQWLPAPIVLLNPAQAVATAALPFLTRLPGLMPKHIKPEWVRYLVTQDPEAFTRQMKQLPALALPYHEAQWLEV